MSEKTAEEKLREELEGKVLGTSREEETDRKRTRSSRVRSTKARTVKPDESKAVNVRQRASTFMEDFEKKIGQSLNPDIFRVPQVSSEKPKQNKEPQVNQPSAVAEIREKPEPVPDLQPQPEVQEIAPEPVPEPEALPEPELPTPEPEPEPELPEPEPEPELPDIPLIEDNIAQTEDELPDIPVISADEIDDPEELELEEDFADIPVIDAEEVTEEEPTEPEEPEQPEDLPNDDELAFYEEPITEAPETQPEDFSPPADVVLNLDEDLPQLQPQDEEPDPEAQPAPVSVTMPESTKTAEDKLMADIAEAMTGNPLTLDSPEALEPYKLPEDFMSAADTEPQSAESKLIANIAQAMSESPLGTAQDQAHQDLEKDLNPFDEMPLPEAINRFEPEPEPAEEPEESEEPEENFLPDFPEEPEQPDPQEEVVQFEPEEETPEPEELEPEPEPEPTEPAEEPEEELNDPFTIPDFDDETEEPEKTESLPQDLEELPVSEDDDTPEPITAQDRLAQELAAFQQREPEESETQDMPDNDIDLEEVSPENDMPSENENLLDDEEPQTEIDDDDDWDMSSLGALSEVASIPDDEPDDIPEPITTSSPRASETEEDYKEKTMGIREKLAAKKNGANNSSSGTKKTSRGGWLLPLLLTLLLGAVVLTLLQIRTLNDRLTAAMMNMGTLDAPQMPENPPSYDYAIDFILDPNINERMALRGREGWQVVGSRRTQDSTTGQYGYEFIFMRRSR